MILSLPSAWRLAFLAKKFLGFLKFLAKILIFLGFLGKINCQEFGKKIEKSNILARNSRLSKIIQDLGKKTKTPSTG